MPTRRQFTHAAVGFAAFGALSPFSVRAQSLELVRIVNEFPAGGAADATSRRVGEKLGGVFMHRPKPRATSPITQMQPSTQPCRKIT